MVKKIFNKKEKYRKIKYFILFIITIIFIFYYYIESFYNKTFFHTPPFNEKKICFI